MIPEDIFTKLKQILPDHAVAPHCDLHRYATDENKLISTLPELVLLPETSQQIEKIMTLAYANNIPVTARGAGTNVTGAAVPLKGGIVLSFEKMNRVLEIDQENMVVICEPGLINGDLQRTLASHNLFYPPDPASVDSCTIGGNVAECAGGMRAVKYGVTKDYVLGLDVVLSNGQLMHLGGKIKKNVAGYDLLHLFVGSEGTLGIITKIILKVIPLPAHKLDLWVPFNTYENAFKLLSSIYKARYIPTAIEFLEKSCINAWELLSGETHRFRDAQAHLIIELDGNNLSELETQAQTIAEQAFQLEAIDVLYADTASLQNKIWETRRKISEAMRHAYGKKVSEDIVVPPASIYPFMIEMKKLQSETGFMIAGYGHLGDGNIHLNILKNNLTEEAWNVQLDATIQKIFATVKNLGGSITGEHGVGLTKKPYLKQAIDPIAYDIMKNIKQLLDPKGILNTDKIF